jgi:hypothetical protein
MVKVNVLIAPEAITSGLKLFVKTGDDGTVRVSVAAALTPKEEFRMPEVFV